MDEAAIHNVHRLLQSGQALFVPEGRTGKFGSVCIPSSQCRETVKPLKCGVELQVVAGPCNTSAQGAEAEWSARHLRPAWAT